MGLFKPTDEQTALIDAIAHNTGNVSDLAYAGAGKTATVIAGLEAMPRSRQALVIYFNSLARKEAEARTAHLPNVKIATNHTYAFAAVGSKYSKGRVGGRISSKRIADMFSVGQTELSTGPLPAEALAAIASSTIRDFTYGTSREITDHNVPWTSLRNFSPDDYEAIKSEAVLLARLMWADKSDSKNGRLPLAHDDYLKIWALSKASWFFRRDLLIMDEAQDANELFASVFMKHVNAQLVAIGDPYQRLYAFRRTVDLLAKLIKDRNATKFHMSRTRRFGGEVVDVANVWLRMLKADLPLVGNPDLSSQVVDEMPEPDAILCRTNAGCIGSAIRMIDADRTFSIGGGTEAIKELAEAALALTQGQPTTHPDLIGFHSWPEVVKFSNDDPNGEDLKVIVKLVTDHGAGELLKIAELAKPQGEAQTHISTIHKVKGAEWNNVQIGDDFTGPDTWPEGQTAPTEDQMMIAYVGVTRAKQALCEGSTSWGTSFLASHEADYPYFGENTAEPGSYEWCAAEIDAGRGSDYHMATDGVGV